MFGGLCFRPLALADEGLGLTIEATSTSHTSEPVGYSDGSVESPPKVCDFGTQNLESRHPFPLYSFGCKHTLLRLQTWIITSRL